MFSRTIRIGIRLALSLALGLAIAFGALNPRIAAPAMHTASTHAAAVCAPSPSIAHCLSKTMTDRNGRQLTFAEPTAGPADSSGSVGYSPKQLHSAYRLPWKATIRQTIAIIDAYDHPTVKHDLDVFNRHWSLPAFPGCSATVTTSCFRRVDQNGAAKGFTNSSAKLARKWNYETNLDVQAAHAICLNCKILLVEAFSAKNVDLARAVNTAARLGATEISNSYELAESKVGTTFYASSYNHAGIAITASAGDDGFGPGYPADLNTVVAVGGTKLLLNADGTYKRETVWGDRVNAPAGSGTGSGCSTLTSAYTSAAWWQRNVTNWAYTGCGSQRSIADVAAVADPSTGFWVYSSAPNEHGGTGWAIIGGTSLSAPVIAGVFALGGHAAKYTWPSQSLYEHLNQFHDVTSGSNGTCTWTIACTGWTGYDGPTGVGTPWGIGGF